MNTTRILLNGDFSYLCQIDWKKALCLVFSEKAKVLKYSDRLIQGVGKVFRAPAVMVLIKVVRSVYRNRVPFPRFPKFLALFPKIYLSYSLDGKAKLVVDLQQVIVRHRIPPQ